MLAFDTNLLTLFEVHGATLGFVERNSLSQKRGKSGSEQ
jgi:hypothetical protein